MEAGTQSPPAAGGEDAAQAARDAAAKAGEAKAQAEAEERRQRETAGKYVVLVNDSEDTDHPTLWALLGEEKGPYLYDGDRDSARRAALDDERNSEVAENVRQHPSRYELVAVPLSSWAPQPVKARTISTNWTFE